MVLNRVALYLVVALSAKWKVGKYIFVEIL